MNKKSATSENGYSLVELLLVIALVSLIAGLAFSRFLGLSEGGAETNLQNLSAVVNQKRDEAIRLNGNVAPTSLEFQIAPLVELDFADPETTKTLIVEGLDRNGDYLDDETGELLTHVEGGGWIYSRRDDARRLTNGWEVVADEGSLPVPPIAANGRGELVTKIGFDGEGRVFGWQKEEWRKFPLSFNEKKNSPDLYFWAVYLKSANETNREVIALAVYPTGQTEKYRFDGEIWQGYRQRVVR